MTPREFIDKWGPGGPAYALNEEQGAQSYFLDLCELLDVPKPGSRADYLFEKQSLVLGDARGYADVFLRDHFAWENKAPGKNLDVALKQLLTYSLALSNPPLLVVCDRLHIRIHTQFNGHPSDTYAIELQELDRPEKREILKRLWDDPKSFRPKKTMRDITEEAAHSFATLAEQLRKRKNGGEKVAHFLSQCLFCFFAEDVGLLRERMFDRLINTRSSGERLTAALSELFGKMRDGGFFGVEELPCFNGGLFKKVDVPRLQEMDIAELRNAARFNWRAIDVSIFGTLFERGLDPAKRSQLGAHYTDPATIERLIDPVVRRPLLEEWEEAGREIRALAAKIGRAGDKSHRAAHARFITWLERLRAYRVLDPACGSGNFLFLALKALKDTEHRSHLDAAAWGLEREQDMVTGPQNVLGLEINDYAAELARVTVWIGELQWRIEHGYAFKTNPVLEPLDRIECRDALLNSDGSEAAWPEADAIVGNPPFLGDKMMRGELGDEYVDTLRRTFAGRVPGGADFVTYWFEKARAQIEAGKLKAAGLVTTNSIRGGANRKVLDRVCETTRIFEAWSDEPWVNDGAAVRVSLVGFGAVGATAPVARLDGEEVSAIHADLTAGTGLDLTKAKQLPENADICFMGSTKVGSFDIEGDLARSWLALPNPHGRPNSEVVKPSWNGLDVTRRPRDHWIVDFGTDMTETDAQLYEQPFSYVLKHVKPERASNNRAVYREYWWRHGEPRPALRKALRGLPRYIVTPQVAKHRIFSFVDANVLPDKNLFVFVRDNDTTFGILSSRFHELWALGVCTWMGVGNDPRYTPTTCFETFPFPTGLTPLDSRFRGNDDEYGIAEAARKLNELRENWLNPPQWVD
ncbi:MAG: N-6 DNA methylase, partial [Candidatus Accumulibacter sp.]|nr:N-6 DNA methylase [Accumulibacter sp.]